jgi:hypothetical protein
VDTPLYVWYGNAAITTDQSNSAATWDANYKAVWHLDEYAASTAVSDSTGNGHNATNQANTILKATTGKIPNTTAIGYTGTSDVTTIPSPAGGDFDFTGGNYSFEFWVKSTSHTSNEEYFGNGTWKGSGYYLQDFGSGNGRPQMLTNGGGSYNSYPGTAGFAVNTWWHVAVVRNGTSISFYLNGAPNGTASGYVNPASSNAAFTIGGSAAVNNGFTGALQEVRVSNTARSASWIATAYANQNSPGMFFKSFPWDVTSHIPPACNAGTSQSVRAGTSLVLNGSASVANSGTITSYFWQQIPSTEPGVPMQPLTWSAHNVVNPTVTGFVGGSMNFQLTVTQSDGESASCVVHHGAVAIDSAGTVSIPNAAMAAIIGPLTQWGHTNNSLPLSDTLQRQWADMFVAARGSLVTSWTNPPNGNPAQYEWGTTKLVDNGDPNPLNQPSVDCTVGQSVCTAHNFSPRTLFCGGGTGQGGAYLAIYYPYPAGLGGDGALQGHYMPYHGGVLSCNADDQHFTLGCPSPSDCGTAGPDGFGVNTPFAIASVTRARFAVGSNVDVYSWWGQNSSHSNAYYESALALYSLYFRTGIDTYLNQARWYADSFWRQPFIDMGNGYGGAPRLWWARSLYLRALDQDWVAGTPGASPMWPGLWYLTGTTFHNGLGTYKNAGSIIGGSDTDGRETSYMIMAEAMCSRYDPNATHRSQCAADLNAVINGAVKSSRYPEPDGVSAWFPSFTDCDVGVKTPAGFNVCGGGGGNNLPASGHATVADGSNAVTFTNSTALSAGAVMEFWAMGDPFDQSTWDSVVYTYTATNGTAGTLSPAYSGTRCAAPNGCKFVMAGPNNVRGFTYESFMLGLFGAALYESAIGLAQNGYSASATLANGYVVEIANELLNYGYNPGYKAVGYAVKGMGNPTTGHGVYPYCVSIAGAPFPNIFSCVQGMNDRELPEGDRVLFDAYTLTGDATLKAKIDSLLAYCFASPSVDGNWCSDMAYPGGLFTRQGQQKYQGGFWGAGGVPTWFSARQGGMAPATTQTLLVRVNLASITNAVKVRVTPTDPAGNVQTPVVCISNPCSVSINPVIGNWALKIEYLSSGNQVLAAGMPFVVTVN